MTENERAINTLDAMKKQFFGETRDVLDVAINALSEIQQYRAIGTVEEVRMLKGKSVAKMPIRQPNHDMTYEEVLCPRCKRYVSKYTNPYCECGQKLDWE